MRAGDASAGGNTRVECRRYLRKFAATLAVDAAERHVLFMRIAAISVAARYPTEIVVMTGVVRW